MAKMHLFKVLLVLTLLTVAWAAPTPPEDDKKGKGPPPPPPDNEHGSIIVTSPGYGPWAIGSDQAVTWRTDCADVEAPYSPDTTVHYGVFAHTPKGDVLIKTEGPFSFGSGYAKLSIGCDYVPYVKYYVQVQLDKPGKHGSKVWGNSGLFTVYETEDKSVCPGGPHGKPEGPYGEPEGSDYDGPHGDKGDGPKDGPHDDKGDGPKDGPHDDNGYGPGGPHDDNGYGPDGPHDDNGYGPDGPHDDNGDGPDDYSDDYKGDGPDGDNYSDDYKGDGPPPAEPTKGPQ